MPIKSVTKKRTSHRSPGIAGGKDCPVEIAVLMEEWRSALSSGDPDRVTQLYAVNAVLLPTVSNQIRHTYAQIRDYFVNLLIMKPRVRIDQSFARIYGDIAIHSGAYTFTLTLPQAGRRQVPARFSFVYHWSGDRWLIVEHHSSMMPESPSGTVLPCLTAEEDVPTAAKAAGVRRR